MDDEIHLKGAHQRIDVLDLKAECEVILEECVDERGLSYLQSLTKTNKAQKDFAKDLKSLGISNPEDKVRRLAESVKRAVRCSVQYKISKNSSGLPSRLWAAGSICQSSWRWRVIRNILIGDSTWDADQSSCWMRTLVFLCKELEAKQWDNPFDSTQPVTFSFRTVELEDWIEHKDEYISRWCQEKNKTVKYCKETLAACANWGGTYRTGFDPFAKLDKELKEISKTLRKVPEFKKYVDHMDHRTRDTGKCETLIGFLTKAIEANLTWACVREWQAQGFSVCCVVHDGMNLYKTDQASPVFVKRLFNAVSEMVAPGAAKWEIKPPDFRMYSKLGIPVGDLTVPDSYVIPVEEDDDSLRCFCGCDLTAAGLRAMKGPDRRAREPIPLEETYQGKKAEFEKKYCQVHCQFVDEEKNDGEPVLLDKKKLSVVCEGRIKFSRHEILPYEQVAIKREDFFPCWMSDEERRYYKRCDTYPEEGSCPEDVYNTWKGYAVTNALLAKEVSDFSEDDFRGCAFFLRHIHRLIDDDFRQFFLEFWAHMLIYPHIKPGLLVGLLGQKRIGKGQTIDMITYQIGMQYYMMTSHPSRDVWGLNGTDCTLGKMLIRLAEPERKEYTANPGAMRVWITDNPVNQKAMRERMETVRNMSRFIHDGNDPILPDEENGGRVAQTLCKSHWKDKFEDPQEFVEYNSELASYTKNTNVQLLLYFFLLRVGAPERFSFHDINRCTGAFAQQERKNNRTPTERFLVYLCDSEPSLKDKLELYECDERDEHARAPGIEGIAKDTIEYHLAKWSRHQNFREPMKCHSMTTMLGKWMTMKNGGVTKCREVKPGGKAGRHVWEFNLTYLRKKFSLDLERQKDEAAWERREAKRPRVDGQRTLYEMEACSEGCDCTCPGKECLKTDEELLQYYIEYLHQWATPSDLEEWISTKKPPRTMKEVYMEVEEE